MEDEWDFQRIRRFMDEQAAMPASSVSYMNAADFIRQLPTAPCAICSTMASEVAATNSRLKAPAVAVELQPVQQIPSITSYMPCQPSMNTSLQVPADQLIFQQAIRVPSFTERVVQASSCVEEIRHDLQQDVAMIPAKHAPKRYKMSSSAEKLFIQPTVATSLSEADQAHGIPWERSGKAGYRKQLQQLQTDHEEPNLELRLGIGHLHNVDVQERTFLYSKAQELQRQRAAAAYSISCHIPVEVPLRSPNEFRYRVESHGCVLQPVASAFRRPTAAASPPIIGSTSTAILPVSSRAAVQQHPLLTVPNHSTAQLEALKEDARAASVQSYRQQFIMTQSASSSEIPIVLPPVPSPTTESYKAPPHQNCSPATTTISYGTIIGHPAYRAIMGTMASRPRSPPLMMMSSMGSPRPPPLMMMSSMGPPRPPPLMLMSSMYPPRLPEILGPTAAQAQRSVISTPFPPGRPLPYSSGDLSLSPPPHAGQQQEVANPAALVQIPGQWTNAPAVATAAVVVVGKVPDFWVTLTKFAVDGKFSMDCSDAEKIHQQQQVQLALPKVISKHLPKEAVPLILRAKVAVDVHNYSASSSSSQPDVGAGAVAQHDGLSDWPVTWRPTAWTSSICDGWSQFVKDGKLEVGDLCRFHQNALDSKVFEVEVTRPIKL